MDENIVNKSDSIKYSDLPLTEKLEWDCKVMTLFCDPRTNRFIAIYRKKEVYMDKGKEYRNPENRQFPVNIDTDNLPEIKIVREEYDSPSNEEFESFFMVKLETHTGTIADFINDELNEINKFPDYVRKEHKILNKWKAFLKEKQAESDTRQEKKSELELEDSKMERENTNTMILTDNLSKYGFFKLEKIQILSKESQMELIKLLNIKKVPYKIAMFKHLEFIQHLQNEYTHTSESLYALIAKILGKEFNNVKKNIIALNPNSNIDREKYQTLQRLPDVIDDYKNLL